MADPLALLPSAALAGSIDYPSPIADGPYLPAEAQAPVYAAAEPALETDMSSPTLDSTDDDAGSGGSQPGELNGKDASGTRSRAFLSSLSRSSRRADALTAFVRRPPPAVCARAPPVPEPKETMPLRLDLGSNLGRASLRPLFPPLPPAFLQLTRAFTPCDPVAVTIPMLARIAEYERLTDRLDLGLGDDGSSASPIAALALPLGAVARRRRAG